MPGGGRVLCPRKLVGYKTKVFKDDELIPANAKYLGEDVFGNGQYYGSRFLIPVYEEPKVKEKPKVSVSEAELQRLTEWLQSTEGREKIRKSLERGESQIEELFKDIDPETLRRPFNI
jgi:hypothetical protein